MTGGAATTLVNTTKPPWAGRQVTDAARYYNLALASRPYRHWSDDERAATDIP